MENIRELSVDDVYYNVTTKEFMDLAKGNNFFHGRFNDGEFNSIQSIKNSLNVNSSNCDGHQYFYELGVDIKQVLTEYEYSNNYIISGGENYFHDFKPMFIELYKENSKLRIQNGYFYYDLIMNPEYFEEFNSFLNEKEVVIIGPDYMQEIKLFKNFQVIEIPLRNAYLSKKIVCDKINELNEIGEPINYCFVAGMMSSVIIHEFSKLDKKNSYFNIGSAWDYFFQSSKYNMIKHRGIYNDLVNKYNKNYIKYII